MTDERDGQERAVERLLRKVDGFPQTGRVATDATGKGTIEMDPAPQVLVNPDGPAAVVLINELAAARDSLAAAVRMIAEDSDYSNELVGIAVRNWFHRRRSSPHPKGTDQ